MITRAEVVATARAWIGTPFRDGQHVKGHGCDCAGLLIGIAKELGEVPPEFSVGPYKQSPDNGKLRKLLRTHLQSVDLPAMQSGDVVSFAYEGDEYHVGVLADYRHGGLEVIHAVKQRGGVVSHRIDADWRHKINAAYSYPSVA